MNSFETAVTPAQDTLLEQLIADAIARLETGDEATEKRLAVRKGDNEHGQI